MSLVFFQLRGVLQEWFGVTITTISCFVGESKAKIGEWI